MTDLSDHNVESYWEEVDRKQRRWNWWQDAGRVVVFACYALAFGLAVAGGLIAGKHWFVREDLLSGLAFAGFWMSGFVVWRLMGRAFW